MSQIAKAQSLTRQLKERLSYRFPTLTISEGTDSQGATLLISDGSASPGEQTMAIRVLGEEQQFKDSIGNAQRTYSPMRIQVIEEESTLAGVSLLTNANKSKFDFELARTGSKQERYLNANGTAPDLTQFASDGSVSTSTLTATISDLLHSQSGQ